MNIVPIKSIKDIPTEEDIFPGTPACAGCGGLLALRHCLKVLGKKVVIVNAAGCFTLLSLYPFTPFQNSWLYTAMACAPAGAQGIRDALDILIKKRRLDNFNYIKTLKPEEVGNFIGDMSYIILKIANICNIDAEKESLKVLEEYEKRFPVEKAKGNHGNVRAGGIDLK